MESCLSGGRKRDNLISLVPFVEGGLPCDSRQLVCPCRVQGERKRQEQELVACGPPSSGKDACTSRDCQTGHPRCALGRDTLLVQYLAKKLEHVLVAVYHGRLSSAVGLMARILGMDFPLRISSEHGNPAGLQAVQSDAAARRIVAVG